MLLSSQLSRLAKSALFVGPCFLIMLDGGCHSHSETTIAPLSPQLQRNIELVVRDHMSVPATWTVTPENPKPSPVPGYNDEDVRFEDGNHQQIVRFLLSTDNQQLGRLSNFPLSDIPGTKVHTAGRPIRGSKDAPVELVDFDDLQCPFCERINAQVFPRVLAEYKGLVRIVYKDFPLTSIHPWAVHASVDANCLAAQDAGAYWSYIDSVHSNHDQMAGGSQNVSTATRALDALALQKGRDNRLNLAALSACVAKQDQAEVTDSIQEGNSLGVNSTPTIFVGGERLSGLPSDPMLKAAINRALKAKGLTPPQ